MGLVWFGYLLGRSHGSVLLRSTSPMATALKLWSATFGERYSVMISSSVGWNLKPGARNGVSCSAIRLERGRERERGGERDVENERMNEEEERGAERRPKINRGLTYVQAKALLMEAKGGGERDMGPTS